MMMPRPRMGHKADRANRGYVFIDGLIMRALTNTSSDFNNWRRKYYLDAKRTRKEKILARAGKGRIVAR